MLKIQKYIRISIIQFQSNVKIFVHELLVLVEKLKKLKAIVMKKPLKEFQKINYLCLVY